MPKRFSLEPSKTGPATSPWCVNIPARISESGKRERKFFATKSAAETYGKAHRIRIENYGTAATLLTPGQLEEAAKTAGASRSRNCLSSSSKRKPADRRHIVGS